MKLVANRVPQRSALRFGLYRVHKLPGKGANWKETAFAYDVLLLRTVQSETGYEQMEQYSII